MPRHRMVIEFTLDKRAGYIPADVLNELCQRARIMPGVRVMSGFCREVTDDDPVDAA